MLIGYSAPTRPTHHRLLVAMGISACSVALLLATFNSLLDSVQGRSGPDIGHEQRLTVHIRGGESKAIPELTRNGPVVPPVPIEEIGLEHRSVPQRQALTVHSPARTLATRPVEDWQTTAERSARASIEKQARDEQMRSSMWRQSYSVMFRPTDDLVAKEEDPAIADIHFRPEIHVVGLGITIGSCFIGIPLAGVPVEDRTADISVVVCAKRS